MKVRLDLNNATFQRQWFVLEKSERNAVLQSCTKLAEMEWHTLYANRGFRWELIGSRRSSNDNKLYSIRITQKMRAVVRRNGDLLELLTLHPDHDSAYAAR